MLGHVVLEGLEVTGKAALDFPGSAILALADVQQGFGLGVHMSVDVVHDVSFQGMLIELGYYPNQPRGPPLGEPLSRTKEYYLFRLRRSARPVPGLREISGAGLSSAGAGLAAGWAGA